MKSPIPIGDSIPRTGNRLLSGFARCILHLWGWRITGSIPDEPKMVLVAAPHTSNWDFIIGMLTFFSLGLQVHWIGKHTIFTPPFGGILRHYGGIPVNRSNPGQLYRDILMGFEKNDSFVFVLSPEGTRSKVTVWKPGFHRIARVAEVPILPASLDFGRKEIHFSKLFYPTDDIRADISVLKSHYEAFTPKHPENY